MPISSTVVRLLSAFKPDNKRTTSGQQRELGGGLVGEWGGGMEADAVEKRGLTNGDRVCSRVEGVAMGVHAGAKRGRC